MADAIPLFPLGAVLLPGAPLPMRVFEPRYHALLADVAADAPPSGQGSFGVVGLEKGLDSVGPVSFSAIGTVAEIMERTEQADGSVELLAVGSRRFRVVGVDDATKPYLLGTVEWLDEQEGPDSDRLLDAALAMFARYEQVLSAVRGRERHTSLATDTVQASYDIAGGLQLDMGMQQRVLNARTAADRLSVELRTMRREIVLLQRTRSVPVALQVLRIAAGPN